MRLTLLMCPNLNDQWPKSDGGFYVADRVELLSQGTRNGIRNCSQVIVAVFDIILLILVLL